MANLKERGEEMKGDGKKRKRTEKERDELRERERGEEVGEMTEG